MEKQRMKDLFNNLNKKLDYTRYRNKDDIEENDNLPTKNFGPKRKVCRKLTFDSVSQDEVVKTNSNSSLSCISQSSLLTCDISQEQSSLFSADKHTVNDSLPTIVCEESFLHSKDYEFEKPNQEIVLPTVTTGITKDTLEDNIQENALRSPAVKIISNVLLPKHLCYTASLQSNNENQLDVPPVLITQDTPFLIQSQEKISYVSTAATSFVNKLPSDSKNKLVCNIDLSKLSDDLHNTLVTMPQKQPLVIENENKVSPVVLRSNRKHYAISPINTDESDVDLSDSDPTFYINTENINKRPPPNLLRSPRGRRRESNSSSTSSTSTRSSSTSSSDTSNERVDLSPERKSRKRKRNPDSWKFNTAKRLRNSGQSYISVKSKNIVNARSIKPPCNEKCRLKCSERIDEEKRKTYFNKFWGLKCLDIQRTYIKSCMIEIKPKYKYSKTENPRKSNNAFYFKNGDKNERVCKTFFINTLDITDRTIRTVKDKLDEQNFFTEDKRGKHNNHKKIDATLVTDIKKFIASIPRVESHYTRATSTCEYISPGRTLTEIYNDFVEQQQKIGRPSGKYCNFYEIFKDTGLRFHQPRKDLCDLCSDYKLTKDQGLKEEFDNHQEEKELSRKEKRQDRYDIDENNICAVYDLEAILQVPLGSSSSFYYKTKMNCYNFTIAELAKKTPSEEESNKAYTDVYNYFWDETQGQKGSTEISTCVLNFLNMINDRSECKSVKVTFYSDNCCGQNKNKFIATLYMYALTKLENINCIVHKYLIKGHTQNKNDNAHSLIEKEIRKYLKAESIYTPVQYIPLIKSAKKTGKKIQVQTLTFEDFIDVKNLQAQWGSNFTKDTNRNPLPWNDIKMLKFCKEEHFKFYFKTSYTEGKFREIDVRAGLRKSLPILQNMVLRNAYTKKFELKENQKKDIKSLIDKKVIPPYFSSYYNDII